MPPPDGPSPGGVTTAWFHCFAGIAGDMALGSLLDAGADADEVRALCRRLPVGGWELEVESVLRGGIAATRAHVRIEPSPVTRTWSHIRGLIEEARLPDRVRDRAVAAFAALAAVEGRMHRRPPERVHFHEVGGVDAVVDVVGTAAALEVLGVDRVTASPVTVGRGMVRSAHGMLPNPAPAVVALLADVGGPVEGVDRPVELTTPTGAALLAATVSGWGPMPPMAIEATGFGAGSRDLPDLPNCTQVVLGRTAEAAEAAAPGQPVVLVEANVDDATGETLAHALAALLDAGAHDAWLTPVVMKKGRPGHVVAALTDPALAAQVVAVLTAETGSLGVRAHRLERWPRARSVAEVEVAGMPVRVKVSAGRVKVEHDDAARAAARSGLPLREVVSLAEEAWRRRRGTAEGSTTGPAPDEPGPQPPDAG